VSGQLKVPGRFTPKAPPPIEEGAGWAQQLARTAWRRHELTQLFLPGTELPFVGSLDRGLNLYLSPMT
jgi:hypothetical protein